MHQGCSGTFENGKQVINKLRSMGYGHLQMPIPLKITCTSCGTDFSMETFESQCPKCHMTYGVTPCHSHDPESVQAAGVNY